MKIFPTTTAGRSRIAVRSPYHPDMVAEARKLNGKWNASQWEFDPRDEQRVREIMVKVYGTDGTDTPELTTVQVEITPHTPNPFFAAGRQVANRYGRDSAVKLGDDVVIVSGDFPRSCGSRNNPGLLSNGVVVLEVRDVPVSLVSTETAEA